MKIFFNSSMPRSGSTLLQNILGNNPDIYSTPTSPLNDLILSAKKTYTTSPQVKAQDENQMKNAFLHYCSFAINGFFVGLTDKKYAIDKSRAWGINLPFLESFYPNPKVICMVRDLRDIVASMEKNYRKHPDKWDSSEEIGNNIGHRVGNWMNHKNKPIGVTLTNLKEIFNRGNHKKILFVRFEDLCEQPDIEMERVYKYLEIPYYKHNFDNIEQVTYEDDKFHGKYGVHKINSKVEPLVSNSDEILGEKICNQIYKVNKWYFDNFKYEK